MRNDQGISDVVGSLVLIGVVTLAISIAGVYLVSRPAPEIIPEIRMIFANTSTALSIQHDGGDSLANPDLKILVNGNDRTTGFTSSGTNPLIFSIGDTLTYTYYPADSPLRTVQVLSTGTGNPRVLASWDFTSSAMPTTEPTSVVSYTIMASATAGGTISPAGPVSVNQGSSRTFTITPDEGYHVADVVVDSVPVGPQSSYTFTNVVANHAISAIFAIDTYTITPSVPGGHGAISPSTPQTVNYGATPAFTFTPDPGYHLTTVTVDGSPITPTGNSYTFPAVTADHSLVAAFGAAPPTLTARNITSGNRGWPVGIALTGTGFQPGAGVRLRQSGYTDIVATSVTVSSSIQIATSIDLAGVAAGTWSIVVINPDGQESNTMTFTVNSPAPTLTVRNPTSGARGWPVSITLTGTGFQPGATVNMTRTGSTTINAYNIVVGSSTQITCTFDLLEATKATNWAIGVSNTDGKSVIRTSWFSVTATNPTVTSITPASGKRGTSVTITNIAGTNFQPGATVLFATNTAMNQNTMTLTNINVESNTKISGTLVIPAGQSVNTYYVRVTNTDATNGRSGSRIFTVTA